MLPVRMPGKSISVTNTKNKALCPHCGRFFENSVKHPFNGRVIDLCCFCLGVILKPDQPYRLGQNDVEYWCPKHHALKSFQTIRNENGVFCPRCGLHIFKE